MNVAIIVSDVVLGLGRRPLPVLKDNILVLGLEAAFLASAFEDGPYWTIVNSSYANAEQIKLYKYFCPTTN